MCMQIRKACFKHAADKDGTRIHILYDVMIARKSSDSVMKRYGFVKDCTDVTGFLATSRRNIKDDLSSAWLLLNIERFDCEIPRFRVTSSALVTQSTSESSTNYVHDRLVAGFISPGSWLHITEYQCRIVEGKRFLFILNGKLLQEYPNTTEKTIQRYPAATFRVAVDSNMLVGLSLPAFETVKLPCVKAACAKQV